MTNPGPTSRQDRREALRTERRQRQHAQAAAARRRRLLLALGGVIAVAVIAVITVILVTQEEDAAAPLPPMVAVSDPYPGLAQQTKVLGDPNAALRLVEYGDYQCPVCQQAQETLVPGLISRYVASGTLSFEFRDFLVIDGNLSRARGDGYDRESLRAAEGAMCAGDQGQYWAFHESLYRNHTGEGVGDFTESRVKDLAAKLGLDATTFDSCLDGGTYEAAVNQQNTDAQAAGVSGTPTFEINGQQVQGSTADDYYAQIDAILVANGITPPAADGSVAPTAPAIPETPAATPVAALSDRQR